MALYYPLTSAIAFSPFAWLPLPAAHACFMGVSGGLLAFAMVTSATPAALWTFGNGAYLHAVVLGQWWPMLMVGRHSEGGPSRARRDDFALRQLYGRWSLLLFCYLPTLVMVLRRPNEAAVVASGDRTVA